MNLTTPLLDRLAHNTVVITTKARASECGSALARERTIPRGSRVASWVSYAAADRRHCRRCCPPLRSCRTRQVMHVSCQRKRLPSKPIPNTRNARRITRASNELMRENENHSDSHRLVGQVVDEEDRPVAGATVRISPSEATTLSDSDGNFEFDGLSAERYMLRAAKGSMYAGPTLERSSRTAKPNFARTRVHKS
jgi:hypothetical protein